MVSHKKELSTRQRIIKAGISLYLEKGFANATNKMVAAAAGVGAGSLNNCFRTKEDLLLVVAEHLAENQRETVRKRFPDTSPIMCFCLEVAAELTLCENNSRAKELHVAIYTLPKTLNFMKEAYYKVTMDILAERLTEWTEQDFYETEIITRAILFGFIMEDCNARFTIDQKIFRCLNNLLKLYNVKREERHNTINAVLACNLDEMAEEMMKSVMTTEPKDDILAL